MTDLNIKINLTKAVFYELIEELKPIIETQVKKQVQIKLQGIFTQYSRDKDLEELRKKIMDDLTYV